ncbi:serine/arginine repetitive matrix protein 2-like [Rana temporaria]|uniref:serine/arginine repetitive matrix protein 2-like n=1 Tax=Rana temporaria TaxID=8407 RepID=UPI001AAD5C7E|nr:serine/arginine repetitive matrix protein 2-like [Rana temporaria]
MGCWSWEENKVRELEEQRRLQWERKRLQKRHSMATCGSLEAHRAVDDLELTLERNLQNLRRTPSGRLCRMRSLGSHNPFAPQRERIRGNDDQKNAQQMRETSERVLRQQMRETSERVLRQQMRETSERVLRQQMEYKRTLSPDPKANFYPGSKIPENSNFQTKADIKGSPSEDRAEISPPSLEIEELEPCVGTQPVLGANHPKPQHVSRLGDPDSLPDNSSPARCVTKAEILEPSGLSWQPLNYEGPDILGPSLETAKPRQTFDATPKWRKPLDGAEISRQSHLPCGHQSQTHPNIETHSQGSHMSGSIIPGQGLVTPCETIPEITNDGIEVTKYSIERNGQGTRRNQTQPKIPGFPPGFETLKPILTHSDSQNFIQFSMKSSSPESGKKSTMKSNAPQGISMWNNPRDRRNSPISKNQPDKKVAEPETPNPSDGDFLDLESSSLSTPETSRLSELEIGPEIRERSLNPIRTKNNDLEASITSVPSPPSSIPSVPSPPSETLPGLVSSRTSNQHNPEHVQQTLPGLVQEERQRSSESSRTSNQHNPEHVQQTLPGLVQEERQRSSESSRTSNHNPEHVQQTLPGLVQEERQRSSESSRTSNHNPEHVQQTLPGLGQEERQRSSESSRTSNHNLEHVQQTLPGMGQEERQRSSESSRTSNHNPEHVQQTLPGMGQEERQRSSESSRTSNHNLEHVQQTLPGMVQEERQRSSEPSRTSNHNPEHVQQTLPGLGQEKRQRSSESPRTSNHNLEHVQQTLPGMVQEERQRSSESSRTSNHNPEHVQQTLPGLGQEERQRSSESSRTSNHNPEHVHQTLPGMVQGERQRSSESSRTSNHNPEHVQQPILSTFPDQSETLPHTLVHLLPETLRGDRSPSQSTLQLPKQYTVKSFKQTLVKSSPKNSRHSVSSTSGPSLVQPRSDTCNPTPPKAELSRTSQPKPGCYMSRIKQVAHLAIKLPAKDMNGQVAPPPHNVVEPTNDASRALQSQDMDYNYYPKGFKDAPVQREALNPCSKWKRELRKASESAESKVESGNVELNKDSPEQKTADHPKTSSLGRTGSGTSKKTRNDLGIRRVFTNKDVGSIHSIVTKHPANTETRDSKIPQKVSAGPAKPPATKPVGGNKEKRESGYTNHSDSSRSERKNSLTLASRPPAASSESPGHGADHGKDPAWPSKKTNSVARVAVHVIKHYEVNSTLTRGARGPYLTTHPVWR